MKYYVAVGGREFTVELGPDGVKLDGQTLDVDLTRLDSGSLFLLRLNGRSHLVATRREGPPGRYVVWTDSARCEATVQDEIAKAVAAATRERQGVQRLAPLVAPMPGLVVRVAVEVGARVRAGQGVVVVEAMKMENELRAAADGVVSAVRVEPGTAVEKGAVLVEFEPDTG